MNDWPKIIQDWIYPPTCLLCGAAGCAGLDLCSGCLASLPRNHPACFRCALGLEVSTPLACGRCLAAPPAFDRAVVPYRYEEPARHLVHGLKFHSDFPGARLMGELIATSTEIRTSDQPVCLIPVPLHPQRYRERGFNQALEIARVVSEQLRVPVDGACCVREKLTLPQSELSAAERRRNLRQAFRVIRKPVGEHVAIVDDVVTTGSTVGELARTLKKAGVMRVDVWAFARA